MSLKQICGILNASRTECNLRACLRGGMSFRWTLFKETEDVQRFIGVLKQKIYVLDQNLDNIQYSAYLNSNNCTNKSASSLESEVKAELIEYFRLDLNLEELYTDWSNRDGLFKNRVATYPSVLNGIRVLRQEPVENLFSFICSSNNNIKRITQMVANMCLHFGNKIGTLEGIDYYGFPTIERLAQDDVEDKLKILSFGYRAKFIAKAAVYLKETHSEEWLYSLRNSSYAEAHKELCKIYGVGRKVADCVCLMSMDKLEAIPVDTHVLSIAKNQYKFNIKQADSKSNSLSETAYKEIGDQFRSLWGIYAGWTQTIMFIDDLKSFDKEKAEAVKSEQFEVQVKQECAEIDLKPLFDIKTEAINVCNALDLKMKSEECLRSVPVKKSKRISSDMMQSPVAKTKIIKKKRK